MRHVTFAILNVVGCVLSVIAMQSFEQQGRYGMAVACYAIAILNMLGVLFRLIRLGARS